MMSPGIVTERDSRSVLAAGCGVDCHMFRDQWRGVAPSVEIVTADFGEVRRARLPAIGDLFGLAA